MSKPPCVVFIYGARVVCVGDFQKSSRAVFGGCKGAEIEKTLDDIEESFERHLERLRRLSYDILDVKAPKWHDDFNYFVSGVKDLERISSFLVFLYFSPLHLFD